MAGGGGPGGGPSPCLGGAAHRMGQVGGVLRGHRAAPPAWLRPHGDRFAAAGVDAQPGRVGGAGRHPGAHDQLGEPRGVGGHPRGGRARKGRRSPREPGTPQLRRLPRTDAAQARGHDRPPGRRRGPLHLRLGPRLPPRLPQTPHDAAGALPGVPVLATTATANARVTADVADQRWAPEPARPWYCAARWNGKVCGSAWSGCRTPPTVWPGSAST